MGLHNRFPAPPGCPPKAALCEARAGGDIDRWLHRLSGKGVTCEGKRSGSPSLTRSTLAHRCRRNGLRSTGCFTANQREPSIDHAALQAERIGQCFERDALVPEDAAVGGDEAQKRVVEAADLGAAFGMLREKARDLDGNINLAMLATQEGGLCDGLAFAWQVELFNEAVGK